MKKNSFRLVVLALLPAAWWLGLHQHDQRMDVTLKTLGILDSSLSLANKQLFSANQRLLWDVNEDIKDPACAGVAERYADRIHQAVDASQKFSSYIEVIKHSLSSGATNFNDGEKQILNRKDIIDSLKMLAEVLSSLVPPKSSASVLPTLPLIDSIGINYDARKLFGIQSLSGKEISTILTQIQNQALRSGNMVATRIHEQVSCRLIRLNESFRAFAGINATIFTSGEILEITAGLGSFSKDGDPIITIDGKEQILEVDGVALYHKKIGKEKQGRIPIIISYFNTNIGQRETVTKTIDYKVR